MSPEILAMVLIVLKFLAMKSNSVISFRFLILEFAGGTELTFRLR